MKNRQRNHDNVNNVAQIAMSNNIAVAQKTHLSIESYHKLNRSETVTQFLSIDLRKCEINGPSQYYMPSLLSYINEDIEYVLNELKEMGLCEDFITKNPITE